MRPIKFRAWDKKYKEMIEDIAIFPEYDWLVQSDNDPLCERERAKPGQIVLMQYTGIRDEEDREIYEGDIVMAISEKGFDHGTHKNEFFEVYWFEENGAWYVTRKYRKEEDMEPLKEVHEMLVNISFELAGNVYKNPELLK